MADPTCWNGEFSRRSRQSLRSAAGQVPGKGQGRGKCDCGADGNPRSQGVGVGLIYELRVLFSVESAVP